MSYVYFLERITETLKELRPRILVITTLLVAGIFGVVCGVYLWREQAPDSLHDIALFMKSTVSEVSEDEMRSLMMEHLMRMHLMDEEMRWAAPEFALVGESILPSQISQEEVFAFIDAVEIFARQNEYLMTFLYEIRGEESVERLIEKARIHGDKEFPSLIAYGMVLDRLTRAMVEDYRVLEASIPVFRNAADEAHMLEYTNTSELEKLRLVEGFILGVVYAKKTGVILPHFGTGELPENIMWAVDIDRYFGNSENAETGEMLTKYGPGYGGGASARMSHDGKLVLLTIPEPLHWTNLYATWNMAYVSQYQDFPMMIVKLLIPTVNNYHGQPEGYLHVRLIALYIHIYHQLLVRADTIRLKRWPKVETVWNDTEFTRLWGKVNRERARDFEKIMGN